MKITFEGLTIQDLFDQMESVLSASNMSRRQAAKIISDGVSENAKNTAAPSSHSAAGPQGPGPDAGLEKAREVIPEVIPAVNPRSVNTRESNPKDKPEKRERSEAQKANDERLRQAALARVEAKRAAKENPPPLQDHPEPKAAKPPKEKKKSADDADIEARLAALPPIKTAEGMDPAEVVRVRQKTIEELQAAYANGFQKEVFELLSRFGNGAKSFRELPPESFVPIREAIDNGALT